MLHTSARCFADQGRPLLLCQGGPWVTVWLLLLLLLLLLAAGRQRHAPCARRTPWPLTAQHTTSQPPWLCGQQQGPHVALRLTAPEGLLVKAAETHTEHADQATHG
jgi:hypothetical protein